MFDAAGSTYAVPASRVVEVVPRVQLRPLAHMPNYLAGLADHGGNLVPVVDMNVMLGGEPSPPRLGTRILLAQTRLPEGSPAVIGLMAEDMDRLSEHPEGGRGDARKGLLGRVLKWGDVIAQEIEVDELLPVEVREALFGSILERGA
jgi:chemotaxis-related protein WspB